VSKFKILLVDDNTRLVESYSYSLTNAGYEVVGAHFEEQALERLKDNFVHLAIVDVRLRDDSDENDKSGLELCEKLDPVLPRIVLTGYVNDWTTIRDALMPTQSGLRERVADGFFYKGAKGEADRERFYSEIKKVLSEHYEVIPEKRLAIITSGGDAPGMNAAIHAATRSALAHNVEVIGVEDGYEGLINNRMYKLRWNSVSEVVMESGTMLRSARSDDFRNSGDARKQAVKNILDKHVSGLIVIGGDGSMNGARILAEEVKATGGDLQIVGIPGTIDNDIHGTDMSLGASSAANGMIDQIRQIMPPAKALRMIFVVEVMGACSGFLALESAIGTGADAVVIPEELVTLDSHEAESQRQEWKKHVDIQQTKVALDNTLENIAQGLRKAFETGKRYGLVIQAEGLDKCTNELVTAQTSSASPIPFMNAEYTRDFLAKRFDEWFGKNSPPVRVQKLGYAVRGVSPSRFDVWLGAASGKRAVELLLDGRSDLMVGWSETEGITEIPISEAVDKSNRPPKEIWSERESWRNIAELQRMLSQPIGSKD
jgi:6-phosphofructokinase 1